MFIETLFLILMSLTISKATIETKKGLPKYLTNLKALADEIDKEKRVIDYLKLYIVEKESRSKLGIRRRSRLEYFTATTDLVSLIATHGHVIELLRVYLEECNNILHRCNQEKDKLDILRKYLKMFEKEHEKMKLEKNHYVGNPLNAYCLIHHLTEELYVIQRHSDLERRLERDRLPFPVPEDWEGAATGIWRLQVTYAMNVTSLADGKLQGTYNHGKKLFEEESTPLSTSALYGVGKAAYNNEDYTSALSWLQEALYKYYRQEPDDTFVYDDSYIIDGMRNAYHGVGDFENAIKWTEKLIEMRPHETNLRDNLTFYQTQLENNNKRGRVQLVNHPYKTLCRGEKPVPEHKRKSLHCHYKFGPSPFLQLAPMKTETLHREPEVYLFHEAISDSEITHLQKRSHNSLKRAQVHKGTHVDYRISKAAWISDNESLIVAKISRRVTDMSGLDTSLAEYLQVGNYGIGGHYQPHYDVLPKSVCKIGENRIATAMFYMSDVELGGATVFIHDSVELTVFPMKNAAIFWHNQLTSGEPDFRTKHGACPVVRGSKWVANKWLHDGGQELIYPCELKYQDNSHLGPEMDRKIMLALE